MNRSPEKQTEVNSEIAAYPDVINNPKVTERYKKQPSFQVLRARGDEKNPSFNAIVVSPEGESDNHLYTATTLEVDASGRMTYTIDNNPDGIGLLRASKNGNFVPLLDENKQGASEINNLMFLDEIIITEKSMITALADKDLLNEQAVEDLLADETLEADIVRIKFDNQQHESMPDEELSPEAVSERLSPDDKAANVARRRAKSKAARERKTNRKANTTTSESVRDRSQEQIEERQDELEVQQGSNLIDNRNLIDSHESAVVDVDPANVLHPYEPSMYSESIASAEDFDDSEEIAEERDKLNILRDKMAVVAGKRQGRLFSTNHNKYQDLQTEYNEQLQRLGRLECAELLSDNSKTDDEKKIGVVAYIFDEQQRLREATAEKLKASKVSRLIEWIGKGSKKAQFAKGALVGGGAVIIGAGVGALAGVAAGAGLAAGAAITAKSVVNFGKYYAKKDNQLGRGIDKISSEREAEIIKDAERQLGLDKPEDSLESSAIYFSRKFNADTEREQEKRRKSARSAIGGVALGLVIGGSLAYAAGELANGRFGDWSNRTIDQPADATSSPDRHMLPPEPLEFGQPDPVNPEIEPLDPGVVPPDQTPPVTELPSQPEMSFDYSSDALTVSAGEGWYQTFNEMGITSAAQQYELLHNEALMQELANQGLAYRDASLGGWGMNMTPNGAIPVKALETIHQFAR